MGTRGGSPGLGARLRSAPALAGSLLGLHLLLAPALEDLRLRAQAGLCEILPGPLFRRRPPPLVPPRTPGAAGTSQARALIAVDAAREAALLLAGSREQLRPGTLVTVLGVPIGIVDSVTEQLARVRGFGVAGIRIPVELRTRGRPLPSGREAMGAVLEGRGGRAVLAELALPLEVADGDEVWSIPPLAGEALLLGEVAGAGLEPRVRVAAWDASWRQAEIAAIGGGTEQPVFEVRAARLLAEPAARGRGALIRIEEGPSVAAGSAVVSGDRLLGLVTGVAGRVCAVARVGEFRLAAEAKPPGGEGSWRVVIAGSDAEVRLPAPPAPGTAALEFRTAPGSGLIPPGLRVVEIESGPLGTQLRAPEPWPVELTVLAFRHQAEAERLRIGSAAW
jgi:hypothetical protein